MKGPNQGILLIEDDSYDVEMMMREFEAHDSNQRFTVLRDGAEALEFLFDRKDAEVAGPLPGAILIGWKLPKFDGLEVLRRLKSAQQTRDIPTFLLLSSQHDVAHLVKQHVQPDGYLIKPVRFGDFTRKLKPAVAQRADDSQVTLNSGTT